LNNNDSDVDSFNQPELQNHQSDIYINIQSSNTNSGYKNKKGSKNVSPENRTVNRKKLGE